MPILQLAPARLRTPGSSGRPAAVAPLGWGDLVWVLDFLERGGVTRLRLDGEPLDHPAFDLMLEYAVRRDFTVELWTDGVATARQRELLAACCRAWGRSAIRVVVRPATGGDAAAERSRLALLEAVGQRARLALDVDLEDPGFEAAAELVSRLDLARELRLERSRAPRADEAAALEAARAAARRIAAQLPRLALHGIRPVLGCGFPLCALEDAQLGALTRLRADTGAACDPTFVIGPDLSVSTCAGPHVGGGSLLEHGDVIQVRDWMDQVIEAHRASRRGVLAACDDCLVRSAGACAGGCPGALP